MRAQSALLRRATDRSRWMRRAMILITAVVMVQLGLVFSANQYAHRAASLVTLVRSTVRSRTKRPMVEDHCGASGTFLACSAAMWTDPELPRTVWRILNTTGGLPPLLREVYYFGDPAGCARFGDSEMADEPQMDRLFRFHCDGTPKPDIQREYLRNLNGYCTLLDRNNVQFRGTTIGKERLRFVSLPGRRRRPLSFWVQVGDHVPTISLPTVTKSRSVQNRCGALMPLNFNRHWKDISFNCNSASQWANKSNSFVWRGVTTGRTNLRRDYVHAMAASHNVKFNRVVQGKEAWAPNGTRGKALSRCEQLQHKYVLSLPGNDVATNLKWLMAQNSVIVMPTPRKEGWLMEGLLLPWVHYAPLDNPDQASELLAWLNAHEDECLAMVRNANRHRRAVLKHWTMLETRAIRRATEENIVDFLSPPAAGSRPDFLTESSDTMSFGF